MTSQNKVGDEVGGVHRLSLMKPRVHMLLEVLNSSPKGEFPIPTKSGMENWGE